MQSASQEDVSGGLRPLAGPHFGPERPGSCHLQKWADGCRILATNTDSSSELHTLPLSPSSPSLRALLAPSPSLFVFPARSGRSESMFLGVFGPEFLMDLRYACSSCRQYLIVDRSLCGDYRDKICVCLPLFYILPLVFFSFSSNRKETCRTHSKNVDPPSAANSYKIRTFPGDLPSMCTVTFLSVHRSCARSYD